MTAGNEMGSFAPNQFATTFPTAFQASVSPELDHRPLNTNYKTSSSSNPQSNKASASPSAGTPPAPYLNPRSCTTCRRRKVRCDKKHPCSNCYKAGIDCIFPGPGRAPRRSKKPPDTELLARLRRLEGVVQSLGKGLDSDEPHAEDNDAGTKEEPSSPVQREAPSSGDLPESAASILGCRKAKKGGDGRGGLEKEFGHLVVSEGRSRYVSNSLWTDFISEIAEMKDILDDPTDEDDDESPSDPDPTLLGCHQGFIFGYSSAMITLRLLHPPAKQILTYWAIYKENVDPLVKLFHLHCTEKLILEASHDLDHVNKCTEAMMFAVYFSAVISLSHDQCKDVLQLDKEIALKRFRFGVEQALVRAGLLGTQELLLLQTFVLFLVSVRRHDDTRFVWTLTGLAIRIANSLGIQRDGQQFGLDPYQTEMRRRLWWQVCTLDLRASEDQGTEPSINDQTFDTKLPLNINDSDIYPGMEEPPVVREGFTEMTFVLVRYEIGYTVRRLSYLTPGLRGCPKAPEGFESIDAKESKIRELRDYLENKYLNYCDINVPIQWVTFHVAKLVMAKMWLMVHHPLKRADGGAGIPQETKDHLFTTAIDIVSRSRLLELSKDTIRWGWLFRTYIQWHGVAFLLSQLCERTKGTDVDEAWSVIEDVFEEWGGVVSSHKKGMLWKPLRKLMTRARAARRRELGKTLIFPTDGSLGPIGLESSLLTRSSIQPNRLEGGLNRFAPSAASSVTNGITSPDLDKLRVLLPPRESFKGTADTYTDTEQWVASDSTLLQDPLSVNGFEAMNWAGWDDLVKDFQMDVQQEQGFESGPVLSGMGDWW